MTEIIISLITAALLGLATWLINVVRKKWKRDQQQHTLLRMKLECIHHGLCSVNHGFKEDYIPAYNQRMHELENEHNFINQ